MKHDFKVVNGCPCPKNLAPYIFIVCSEAHTPALSIYRGTDAERLLKRLHKMSQRQLYEGFINHKPGFLPANPPGHSTHEQFSDGVAYPEVPNGHTLQWWQIGFDVNPELSPTCMKVAKRYGWTLFRPYPSGLEFHHLNFRHEPIPHTLKMRMQIRWVRHKLPDN